MKQEKQFKTWAFLFLSVMLHVLLFVAIPWGLFVAGRAGESGASILLRVAPAAWSHPARPAPQSRSAPRKETEKQPATTAPQPESAAPAPATIPKTAVVSHSTGESAGAAVVPVGNDTGGAGLTDSKGESRENREITSGAAPVAKPLPPQHVKEADIAAIRAGYARLIRERIAARREYPAEARRRGREGVAVVQFTLDAGAVSSVSVTRSSGLKSLDDAAVEAVRRAAPFPQPPPELGRDPISIRVPIVFRLDTE